MARCGCGTTSGSCNCFVTGGTNTTVTGDGSAGSPFVVNAVTDCPSVRACITGGDSLNYDPVTGDVDLCLSTDVGNAAALGTDGCLFVATGAATVTAGCGLVGNGSPATPIRANVATWPFACADTEGADVYCGADGQLRSEPPHTSDTEFTASGPTQTIVNPLAVCGVLTQVSERLAALTFTNPSACRSMNVDLSIFGRLRADIESAQFDNPVPVSAGVNVLGQYRVNGGAYTTYRNATWDSDATANSISATGGDEIRPPQPVVVPPGGNIVVDTRIMVICTTNDRVVRVVINEPSVTAFGVTV